VRWKAEPKRRNLSGEREELNCEKGEEEEGDEERLDADHRNGDGGCAWTSRCVSLPFGMTSPQCFFSRSWIAWFGAVCPFLVFLLGLRRGALLLSPPLSSRCCSNAYLESASGWYQWCDFFFCFLLKCFLSTSGCGARFRLDLLL
jgi:hypothetical protein